MRYKLNMFARWLIKHYETSTDENHSFCYRNSMGEIVEITDIVDHYMQEHLTDNDKAREYSSPIIEELINETTPEELEKLDKEMEVISTNEKQTPLDAFAIALYEGGYLQGNGDKIQKLFEKYKSIENSIMFYWFLKGKNHTDKNKTFDDYYNETYGGKKIEK